MKETVGGTITGLAWPSLKSFMLVWFAVSLLTWVLVCGLTLVFMYPRLHASMVPWPVLFILAGLPILTTAFICQSLLFFIGRTTWPDSPDDQKKLVLYGIIPVTWIVLGVLSWLTGGVESFIVVI